MFSYVAKSLLSKTLRTFLRKYLENIELDSINYGSTSENSSSGWEVRLSNVKLREGMELMKLPGKRKRVVTGKNDLRRDNGSKKSCADNSHTHGAKREKEARAVHLEVGEKCVLPESLKNGPAPHIADEIRAKGLLPKQSESFILTEEIECRDGSFTTDSENGYFSDYTPTQSRLGVCGVPPAFCLNANNKKGACLRADEKYSSSNVVLVVDDTEELCKQRSFEDLERTKVSDSSTTSFKKGNHQPMKIPMHNRDVAVDDSEKEELIAEDDLVLVVGEGGVIGTLNIRMVEKGLHISIEDAHLVLEALPDGGGNGDKPTDVEKAKTSQNKSVHLGRAISSSSESDFSSPVNERNTITTIGERIKQNNMIARHLSMVPHLFLRDCQVSLILPEENGEKSTNSCDDCTILEFGIDFLSVTSGDDFLDLLQFNTGNESSKKVGAPHPPPPGSRRKSPESSDGLESNPNTQNIYERKRIRTGKGPNGGLWLKVHPPLPPLRKVMQYFRARHRNEPKWSRQRFLDSSESFFLQCSGIDLHARLLVDIKESTPEEELERSNEYEDYTMDSMLFGVDYVDPKSFTRHQISRSMGQHKSSKTAKMLDVSSDIDSNGIHSIPIPEFQSNFHWIAQRAHRRNCTQSHLPLNDCFFCWNECVYGKDKSHSAMNNLIPLPGFVMYLSMTDPLELNIDRGSLEALGYVKSLFSSRQQTSDKKRNTGQKIDCDITHRDGIDTKSLSCTFDDKSFPAFMQPEAIHLAGFYASKIVIRFEAIGPRIDHGGKFRFWQFIGESIYLEESQVDSEEQTFSDRMFHVARMEWSDFTGACQRTLLVAGAGLGTHLGKEEIHVQCTAARILGLASTPAAVEKRLSQPYALHMRLIRSDAQKEMVADKSGSSSTRYVNLQIGVVNVDIDDNLSSEICVVAEETRSIFSKMPEEEEHGDGKAQENIMQNPPKWIFQIVLQGGAFSYQPRIKLKIPPESKIRLRKSSEGLSFKTFLQMLDVEYGSYMFEKPRAHSIIPLCSLPDNLRMHILLYLGDISSLERVLYIKKKKATLFLRCHTVNKKLACLASSTRVGLRYETETKRRNRAISRLQSLDIEALEALIAIHER